MLASQFVLHANADKEGKLTKAQFTALADTWFDKLDTDHSGQLSTQLFADRLNDLLSAPPPLGAHGTSSGPPWGGGGYGRGIGRSLFAAADANHDGSLTRNEFKSAFDKWSVDWDQIKTASSNESGAPSRPQHRPIPSSTAGPGVAPR